MLLQTCPSGQRFRNARQELDRAGAPRTRCRLPTHSDSYASRHTNDVSHHAGGAGFIGSYLGEELLADDHRVKSSTTSTGPMENIRHFNDSRFGYTIDPCSSVPVVAELVREADISATWRLWPAWS